MDGSTVRGFRGMRKIKGPYWTLLAGLVTATVLLTLDVRATPSQGVAQNAGTAYTPPTTSTSSASTAVSSPPPPTRSPTAPPGGSGASTVVSLTTPNPDVVDYAGRVD